MILESSRNPRWLSNTWLLAEERGGCGVIVDSGGPVEPLLGLIRREEIRITHILNTHHHPDHILENGRLRRELNAPVVAHVLDAARIPDCDLTVEDGQVLESGILRITCLHIPGHTAGQLAFLAGEAGGGEEALCFTGDTLFRGSVGGTCGPGHTTFADLRHSILEVLMALPPATRLLPGHMEPSTVAAEWERNPFIRAWRGLDPPAETACTALGRPATLLLRARDYDGGTKAWVRFRADGREDVVPGSRVS
ncbi:MAG: MBL fold metallo-hydrolase [Planctomycetota bacterium]